MYVVSLVDGAGKLDADKVYDPIHLVVTREIVLSMGSSIDEDKLSLSCDRYFQALQSKKNTGTNLVKGFLQWETNIDVRKILRGDRSGQEVQFLVEPAPECVPKIEEALKIKDKFERRRALRALAPQIAGITISRYGSECPDPDAISDWVGPFRVLKPGCYDSFKGLVTDEA